MVAWRLCLCALAASAPPRAAAAAEAEEAVCRAGEQCAGPGGASGAPYFWPSARGDVGRYGVSPYAVPTDLEANFSWKYYHPRGQYSTIALGCVIDDKKNVYLSAHDAISKLSPDGKLIWSQTSEKTAMTIPTVPALKDGRLFGSTHDGHIFALSMETGEPVWATRVANEVAGDTSFVTVHDGIVVAGADSTQGERNARVFGLNATDGSPLWTFKPDAAVWNFMALFPDDGTFVFQDLFGRAYRCNLADGSLIWKAGGHPDTWTDGTLMLGPRGSVYGVTVHGPLFKCALRFMWPDDCKGSLTQYSLSDGRVIFNKTFPRPTNIFPAVGRLSEGAGLSVVMPIGQQAGMPVVAMTLIARTLGAVAGLVLAMALLAIRCLWSCRSSLREPSAKAAVRSALRGGVALLAGAALGVALMSLVTLWLFQKTPVYEAEVLALDAETGEEQWRFELPPWVAFHTAGDPEGLALRHSLGSRQLCIPNPFSAPTIGPDGTIYLGFQDGKLYAIRDANRDGVIDAKTEVSTYATGTAFSSPGAAFAPGMLAIANCDGLFVFKH